VKISNSPPLIAKVMKADRFSGSAPFAGWNLMRDIDGHWLLHAHQDFASGSLD